MSEADERQPIPLVVVAALLALLVAWSFARRWAILDATPYPTGIDGYFYAIELRALLEDGALAYPASPLAFWLLAPFAAATDPIVGAKLGAAFYGALVALPAYGVGARLGRSRGAGLVAATLAATSAGSVYTSVEFVKNGIGLTIALTALWLVLRACERPTRGRAIAAAGATVAAVLAHKMAAGIAIAVAIPAVLAEARVRGALDRRRLRRALVACGALVAAAIVLGVVFPQRFLAPGDARLVASLVTTDAHASAPALVDPRGDRMMGHEALIGELLALVAVAAMVGGWLLARRRDDLAPRTPRPGDAAAHAVAIAMIALALVIGLPWLAVDDAQGLGFRLRVAAYVPMAICAAIAAGRLLARVPYRELLLGLVAFGLVDRGLQAIARTPRLTAVDGEVVVHPALVSGALALHVPPGATVIVPERHVAFMIAYYTRAPVSIRPEPIAPDARVRVLPGAFVELGSPIDDALLDARAAPDLPRPVGTHARYANGLVMVPEATWTWVLAHVPPDAQARWSAWPTR